MGSDQYFYDDKALIFPTESTAILCDIHFSHTFSDDAVTTLKQRLHTLVDKHELTTLIFNGDTFNEFPFLESGIEILYELQDQVEIILIEGNHEEQVGGFTTLADDFTVTTEITITSNETSYVITHGHQKPTQSGDVYIIGHLHPTIGSKQEQPCAVRMQSQYDGKDVLILPAFVTHEGQNIEVATENSPLIQGVPKHIVEKKF